MIWFLFCLLPLAHTCSAVGEQTRSLHAGMRWPSARASYYHVVTAAELPHAPRSCAGSTCSWIVSQHKLIQCVQHVRGHSVYISRAHRVPGHDHLTKPSSDLCAPPPVDRQDESSAASISSPLFTTALCFPPVGRRWFLRKIFPTEAMQQSPFLILLRFFCFLPPHHKQTLWLASRGNDAV